MCSTVTSFVNFYDMVYLLTAIGLLAGGSSSVHIYTQTIHRTTQNKQYVEQHKNLEQNKNFGNTKILNNNKILRTMRTVPLGELYPGICLTTEEKARRNLSQGNS